MRFINDRQRKAAFANMMLTKFSRSEDCDNMVKLNKFSNDRGITEPLWEVSDDLRQDIIAPKVEGFTGGELWVREGNNPIVSIPEYPGGGELLSSPTSDTIILAGKGYKGVVSTPMGLEIDTEREKTEGPREAGSTDVYKYTFGERKKGYPVFAKKSDEEQEDILKEKLGEKLQKEFEKQLPEYMASSVDWYGIADPKISLADNRKKVQKDLGGFLGESYSSRPRRQAVDFMIDRDEMRSNLIKRRRGKKEEVDFTSPGRFRKKSEDDRIREDMEWAEDRGLDVDGVYIPDEPRY